MNRQRIRFSTEAPSDCLTDIAGLSPARGAQPHEAQGCMVGSPIRLGG